MAHYKRNKSLIPIRVAEQISNYAELVQTGFAIPRSDGVYCAGADKNWGFLLARSAAGKKSAEKRRKLYGTAIPQGGSNFQTPAEQSLSKTEHAEPSSSSSSSKNSCSSDNNDLSLKPYISILDQVFGQNDRHYPRKTLEKIPEVFGDPVSFAEFAEYVLNAPKCPTPEDNPKGLKRYFTTSLLKRLEGHA